MALSTFDHHDRLAAKDLLGYVQGISLPTVLQMLELDRSTCIIRVHHGAAEGLLHLAQGRLIDAEAGALSGVAAAYEILAWQSDDIEIRAAAGEPLRRIDSPLTMILLDSSRRSDERQRGRYPTGGESLSLAFSPSTDGDPQEEDGVNTLQTVLERFREEVPEFVSTDIVNVDSGLSIGGGSVDPDFEASIAAASYAEVVKSNRRALELLGIEGGSTEDILISTGRVYLLIRPMGEEYYHLLAVGRRGNLGLARAIMKKYEPKILAAIGELS
jgi:predicted regulator of Ras-like GTPase activity (Roadblock/LC7/MglB family)